MSMFPLDHLTHCVLTRYQWQLLLWRWFTLCGSCFIVDWSSPCLYLSSCRSFVLELHPAEQWFMAGCVVFMFAAAFSEFLTLYISCTRELATWSRSLVKRAWYGPTYEVLLKIKQICRVRAICLILTWRYKCYIPTHWITTSSRLCRTILCLVWQDDSR